MSYNRLVRAGALHFFVSFCRMPRSKWLWSRGRFMQSRSLELRAGHYDLFVVAAWQ